VPALDAGGNIHVVDKDGGLSSFTPAGDLRWRAAPEGEHLALAGPVVAPTGTIYYPVGRGIVAVAPDGEVLWLAPTPQTFSVSPPQTDAEGKLLFWQDSALQASDGGRLELEVPFDTYEYLVGGDGFNYTRSANIVSRWDIGDSGFEIVESANWDYRSFVQLHLTPLQAGVTRDRVIWLFYAPMRQAMVAWLDTTGRVLGTLSVFLAHGRMIAVGEDATAYLCGQGEADGQNEPVCYAYRPGSEEPIWRVEPPKGGRPLGGSLVPGRLYVAYEGAKAGFLYALGEP
jgi:hypothetical protein